MAIAENLRATHAVDERVRGVTEQVLAVDDRVAGVDDRLANVDDKVMEVIHDGKEARQVIEQTANDVDQVKQNQLRERIHSWLSPPDPSTNHNIACDTHHKKSATWFFEGTFTGMEIKRIPHLDPRKAWFWQEYPLILKHCATPVKHRWHTSTSTFETPTSKGYTTYFLPFSPTFCSLNPPLRYSIETLFRSRRRKDAASDSVLTKCLKDMLTLPGQHPIYLIMDALDESSATSGIPSAREKVLELVRSLLTFVMKNSIYVSQAARRLTSKTSLSL
ncbi:hypothetical protein BGY98DRAFT_154074 [Russula aff. rugulosa BPL654]|nr:hypothetical protein BGY98DRAFT_154074 [Russula aff. rugulosa BPL654]